MLPKRGYSCVIAAQESSRSHPSSSRWADAARIPSLAKCPDRTPSGAGFHHRRPQAPALVCLKRGGSAIRVWPIMKNLGAFSIVEARPV
jgi:hypothetical protein